MQWSTLLSVKLISDDYWGMLTFEVKMTAEKSCGNNDAVQKTKKGTKKPRATWWSKKGEKGLRFPFAHLRSRVQPGLLLLHSFRILLSLVSHGKKNIGSICSFYTAYIAAEVLFDCESSFFYLFENWQATLHTSTTHRATAGRKATQSSTKHTSTTL